jgi:hypothetical protein
MNGSKGCETAIKIIDGHIQLRKDIHIQDIKLIEKPSWLKGVPVLAKISTKEIWEGSFAIDQLHYLAGYYSALSTVSNTKTAQPWNSYQPNLSLNVTPVTPVTNIPDQTTSSSNTSMTGPMTISVTSTSTPTPTPTVEPTPLPMTTTAPVPMPVITPTITPNLASSLSETKTDKSNPNKLQPLPLPDDQRNVQELNIPPPLPNIKAIPQQTLDATTPQPPQSSPVLTSPQLSPVLTPQPQPPQSSPVPPPPQPKRTTRRTQSSQQVISTNTDVPVTVPVPVPVPTLPGLHSQLIDADHVSMVFTTDELQKIRSVMSHPTNSSQKRQDTDVFNVDEPVNNVRVFPVTAKKHNMVVQMENHDPVDTTPPA